MIQGRNFNVAFWRSKQIRVTGLCPVKLGLPGGQYFGQVWLTCQLDNEFPQERPMYKILFFEAMEPLTEDFHETYCDCLFSMQCDYRPMLGDIFYLGRPANMDTLAIAYEVEAVVCVHTHVFHAYCVRIEPDSSYPPYYGARGVKGSLVSHTEDQIKDFPERYKLQPPEI